MKRQSRIFALVQYVKMFDKHIKMGGSMHAFGGHNSECVVFGQAAFQAARFLVPANTACYAGYYIACLVNYSIHRAY
jgi:hypothetical protein